MGGKPSRKPNLSFFYIFLSSPLLSPANNSVFLLSLYHGKPAASWIPQAIREVLILAATTTPCTTSTTSTTAHQHRHDYTTTTASSLMNDDPSLQRTTQPRYYYYDSAIPIAIQTHFYCWQPCERTSMTRSFLSCHASEFHP